MKHRKLRIAWSVVWGIAAALLVALWVRSYWWADLISIRYYWPCAVVRGSAFYRFNLEWASSLKRAFVIVANQIEIEEIWLPTGNFHVLNPKVTVPLWPIALACMTAGAVPWIRRFSLRTLLIATTLVAVGLALIRY